MNFVSSDSMVSRIKTTYLKSFNQAGLVDVDDFYYWIKECLHELGLGAMVGAKSILTVDRFKAKIPKDLVEFYSIHRLTATNQRPPQRHWQETNTWYFESSQCNYQRKKCCNIEEEGTKIIFDRYYDEKPIARHEYCRAGLLRYTPNRGTDFINKCNKRSPCVGTKYQHLFHPVEREFHTDSNYFHFQFTDEEVYLQYHAFPLEDGLPMVPDQPKLQKYIQDYIIYQSLYTLWLNSTSADLERRYLAAERTSNLSKDDAISWIKLPEFRTILAHKQHQEGNFAPFEY